MQTFAFKGLQESSSLASGNGAVQMFFLTPKENKFAGQFENAFGRIHGFVVRICGLVVGFVDLWICGFVVGLVDLW